jgi:NAD(P)-dependent dehydrogenase (short-subunit alcohol dehydrogenase family)
VPGWLILALDRDGEAAAQIARAVDEAGRHGAAVGCDVTGQADIQAAVAAVGVLINSAGAAVPGSARVWRREAELAADDADRFFDWPVGCGQLRSVGLQLRKRQ